MRVYRVGSQGVSISTTVGRSTRDGAVCSVIGQTALHSKLRNHQCVIAVCNLDRLNSITQAEGLRRIRHRHRRQRVHCQSDFSRGRTAVGIVQARKGGSSRHGKRVIRHLIHCRRGRTRNDTRAVTVGKTNRQSFSNSGRIHRRIRQGNRHLDDLLVLTHRLRSIRDVDGRQSVHRDAHRLRIRGRTVVGSRQVEVGRGGRRTYNRGRIIRTRNEFQTVRSQIRLVEGSVRIADLYRLDSLSRTNGLRSIRHRQRGLRVHRNSTYQSLVTTPIT